MRIEGRSKRRVIRVAPNAGGTWDLTDSGGEPRLSTRKFELVKKGRERCRRHHREGGLAQLVLHDRKGKFQIEFTYGKDPVKTPG